VHIEYYHIGIISTKKRIIVYEQKEAGTRMEIEMYIFSNNAWPLLEEKRIHYAHPY
jgi:hypothetical protein